MDAPSPMPQPIGLEVVAQLALLQGAWEHIRKGRPAPGIDRVTVDQFERDAPRSLEALRSRLLDGTYRPRPALRVRLSTDPERPLAIPTIADRIVQRALASALRANAEPSLSPSAWAYRPGRSVELALRAAERHLRAGRRWFVRTDITNFFGTIPREPLLDDLARLGLETPVLALVRRLLDAGVVDGAVWRDDGVGVSQGSALSPLLSNVALTSLDRAVEATPHGYVRYADDILLLSPSEEASLAALERLAAEVEARGYRLSQRKTQRGFAADGFVFLGMALDDTGRRRSRRASEALDRAVTAALAEGGDRAPEDLIHSAASAVATWSSWYGEPEPHLARELATLVGAVSLDEASTHARWVRRRLELPATRADWSPTLHALAARTWAALPAGDDADDEARRCALLLDAARALAARPALAPNVATSLGCQVDLLRPAPATPDELAERLSSVGLTRFTLALRRHRAGREAAAGVEPPEPSSSPEEALPALVALLGSPRRHAIEGRNGRGQWVFRRVDHAPDEAALLAHLAGGPRIAAFPCRADHTLRFATVTIALRRAATLGPLGLASDPGRAREGDVGARGRLITASARTLDAAATLRRSAERLGLAASLEATGDGAHRLWFPFLRPVRIDDAFALLSRILADAGPLHPDLVVTRQPATDRASGTGPWVTLPWGKDPRTGAWSHLVTELDPSNSTRTPATSLVAQRIPYEDVLRLVRPPRVGPGGSDTTLAPTVDGLPRLRSILAGCAVLRALAEKAATLRMLEAFERHTLFDTLASLPKSEREGALTALLREVPGWDRRAVQRRLEKDEQYPMSCAGIRRRHPTLTQRVDCNCQFRGLWGGVYPTPVLHAVKPFEIDVFAEKLRKAKDKRKNGRRAGGPEGSRRTDAGGRREEPRPPHRLPSAQPSAAQGAAARLAQPPPADPAPDSVAEAALPTKRTGSSTAIRVAELLTLCATLDELGGRLDQLRAELVKDFEALGVREIRAGVATLRLLDEHPPRFRIIID